jgi:hypothetical protein
MVEYVARAMTGGIGIIRRWPTAPFVLASVAIAMAVGAGRASAMPTFPNDWCSQPGVSPPCIVSATANGMPLTPTDPTYRFIVGTGPTQNGDTTFTVVANNGTTGSADLGTASLSDMLSIVVNTGTIVPRVTFAQGSNVTFARTPEPGGTYQLTITGRPVTITDNTECNFSGPTPTCPFQAMKEYAGYFSAQIDDYNFTSQYDTNQIDSFYGMSLTTNVAETALPPEILANQKSAPNEIVLQLANQHELPDSTVFQGFLHMRIPNAVLQWIYGIDDPSTLTSGSVVATIGSGTVSVAEDASAQNLLVDITGITFSSRTLTITEGTITPAAPTGVRARRRSRGRAVVSFQPVQPRGSAITGYQANCTSKRGVSSATSATSPITLKHLSATLSYRCTVTAMSKAGSGPASAGVKLPATKHHKRRHRGTRHRRA